MIVKIHEAQDIGEVGWWAWAFSCRQHKRRWQLSCKQLTWENNWEMLATLQTLQMCSQEDMDGEGWAFMHCFSLLVLTQCCVRAAKYHALTYLLNHDRLLWACFTKLVVCFQMCKTWKLCQLPFCSLWSWKKDLCLQLWGQAQAEPSVSNIADTEELKKPTNTKEGAEERWRHIGKLYLREATRIETHKISVF